MLTLAFNSENPLSHASRCRTGSRSGPASRATQQRAWHAQLHEPVDSLHGLQREGHHDAASTPAERRRAVTVVTARTS